jgi:hypothetical protein
MYTILKAIFLVASIFPGLVQADISKLHKKVFKEHINHYQLDEADVHALVSSAGGAYGDDITPEGIASLSLGASLFTNVGQFNNTPIFDLSALLNDGRVDKLPGSGVETSSFSFSTSTSKHTESDKAQNDYSASLQFGGWKAKGGYAQDNASNKSNVTAASALYAFQVGNSYMRLYPQDGDTYQEWSSYLVGGDITEVDFNSYVPGCPFNQYSTNNVITLGNDIRAYSGMGGAGSNTNSPRAHYQSIVLMEKCFSALSAQYGVQAQGADRDATLASMYRLANNINSSIKYFYNKYGEAFVTSTRAYNMVKGSVTLSSSSDADNTEWMKSGSVALSYSGWFAGADAKYAFKQLHNTSNAYSIENVVGNAETIPNLSMDLNSYTTSLVAIVKAAIANSSATTQLPSVQLQLRDPVLPDPRPLKDNPFIPDEKKLKIESYADYKKHIDEVKNDWTDPAEAVGGKIGEYYERLKNWIGPAGSAELNSGASAQQNVENLVAAVGGQRPGLPGLGPDGEELIANNVQNNFLAANEGQSQLASTKVSRQGGDLDVSGKKLLKRLKWESRKLKQYGVALRKKERAKQKKALPTILAEAGDNKIQFPNSRVYGFDATPTAAVLSGLRFSPSLPSDGFKGLPVISFLMGDLTRYRNVLTYLNFISAYSISGLKDKDVLDDFRKFMQDFDAFVTGQITKALVSGGDMSIDAYSSIMSGYVTGKLSGGASAGYDESKTTLYKVMGSLPQYKYIRALADNPFIYKTLSRGARGYIPLVPGGCKYDSQPNDDHRLDSKVKMLRYDSIISEPVVGGLLPRYITKFHCSSDKQVDFDTSIISLYRDATFTPMFPVFKYDSGSAETPRLVFMQVYGNATIVLGYQRAIVPEAIDSLVSDLSLSGFQPPASVSDISSAMLEDYWLNESGYAYKNVRNESVADMPAEWGWSINYVNNTNSSLTSARENEVLTLQSPVPVCVGQWVGCPEMIMTAHETFASGMHQVKNPTFSNTGMTSLPLVSTYDAVGKKILTPYNRVRSDSTYLFLLPIRDEWLSDDAKSLSFSYGIGSTAQSIFAGSGDNQPVNNAYTRAIVESFVSPPTK